MEITIIEAISPIILMAIGLVLIAFETFVMSFVLIWFGVGFFSVGVLSHHFTFNDGIWQLATVSIVSVLLLFLLRMKFVRYFLEDDMRDDFWSQH